MILCVTLHGHFKSSINICLVGGVLCVLGGDAGSAGLGVAGRTDVSALPRITSPISCEPKEAPPPAELTGNERAEWPQPGGEAPGQSGAPGG